jgi:hypothetical protein
MYKISFLQELVTQGALFVGTFEVDTTDEVTYCITSQEITWDFGSTFFPITNDPNLISSCIATVGNSNKYSDPSYWECWFISSGSLSPQIAYGLYRVTNDRNNNMYFFLDTRDCKYGPQYNVDIYIRYYFSRNIMQFSAEGTNWTSFSSGDVLNVWDIKNNGNPPLTTYFEPPVPWGLTITSDQGINHPILQWLSNGFNTGYPIDRKSGNGDWNRIDTALTNYFVDGDITWPGGNQSHQISYRVWGLNGTIMSATHSNVESIFIDPELQKKAISGSPAVFTLNQNYPNPFNPTTFISYQLPAAGHATLKVYDVLGREIKTLVNEFKLAGKYQIEFEASNLSSGVYFYKINAGDFYDIKEMILIS